jgi:hypothetical protein
MSTIINTVNETLLLLGVTTCLPRAVAELMRACIPVITAIAELRDQVSAAKSRCPKPTPFEPERNTTE